MSNLNEKMKEQSTLYAEQVREIEFEELALSGATLDRALGEVLKQQKDVVATIDATQFSTLNAPIVKSPTQFKKLVTQIKEDAPNMGKKAAKSGVKSLLKKVPLGEGIVDAAEALLENRFRKRGWILAGQAIVADATEEIPIFGGALRYGVKKIKLVKDKTDLKNNEETEVNVGADGSEAKPSKKPLAEFAENAKKEAPKMGGMVIKSEVKKALREVPFADGVINAGDVLIDDKFKKRGWIRAGQAVVADASGEIPLVGNLVESVIKKVKLVKDKKPGEDLEESVEVLAYEDDIYYVPDKKNNEQLEPAVQTAKVASINETVSKADKSSEKSASEQLRNNFTSQIRQLRGMESGVEKCIYKKTTLNQNYAASMNLSR